MKTLLRTGILLSLATTASAAPNVTNIGQKGSLLIFPDVRVDTVLGNLVNAPTPLQTNGFNTLIRIQNDGNSDVTLKCFWLDGHKNRVDFVVPVGRTQASWFNAKTGGGSVNVNPFPTAAANGFTAGNRHPFLEAGGAFAVPAPNQLGTTTTFPNGDGYGPYRRGALVCWVVDDGVQQQVKWNHLSGTATVYTDSASYEYNAYAFFVPTGTDLDPVGTAGTINLNGLEYDSCPLYQIGQFTPAVVNGAGYAATFGATDIIPLNLQSPISVLWNRVAVTGCTLNLNQDWTPVWTKLQFDIWNGEEIKFTGAFECADTWHETDFRPGTQAQNNGTVNVPGFVDGVDAAGQNFFFTTLATRAARYRVQGIKSTQCDRTKSGTDTVAAVTTQAVGIVAVQSSVVRFDAATDLIGTPLAAAGKANGKVVWDPSQTTPEGGVR
ncbi:MAG: hypothetical protein AB7I50_01165 [Vicinamibacterales bacterium]